MFMIFIVLPAYNEEKALSPLLKGIDLTLREHRVDYKIILVDDGSTDRTREAAESLGKTVLLEVVSHPQNRGLGEAIKTGLVRAADQARDHDVIITMDADNTHVPGLMLRLQRNIWEGCDMVIASRYCRQAQVFGVPVIRRLLSRGASLLFRIFFPIPGVKDYTSGYRAYQASLLKKAFKIYGNDFVSESGFSCQIDILLKLNRLRPIVSEVPIILKYDRRGEATKMKMGRAVQDSLSLLARRFFQERVR